MARLSGGKLTNLRCTTAGPGTHADGHGLYLQVRPGANGLTRSWVYRYATAGKETWLGLGPFPLISLAAARRKTADARLLRLEGHDPLAQRRNLRASLSREQAKQTIPTFDQCRDAYRVSSGRLAQRPAQPRMGAVAERACQPSIRQHPSGHD